MRLGAKAVKEFLMPSGMMVVGEQNLKSSRMVRVRDSSSELRDGARGRLGSRSGGQSSQYSRSCMFIDNVR